MIRCGVWAVVALGVTAGAALAQPAYVPAGQSTGPATRPTFSPYLNLLRGSNSPGVNYYGLVRPQVQAQSALSTLQATLGQPAGSPFDTIDPSIPVTGQPFGYMTHTSYFLNNRAGGRGNSSGGVIGGRIGGAGPTGSGVRR